MIETARTVAIVGFVLTGLFFTFVSAAGVLRLPDVYSRAHTASQADTLGAGFALAGVALALGWSTTTVKTVLLLFFIFVTNPTAAHAISRAAHEQGIEPWTTDDDRTDRDLHEAARSRRLADGGRLRTEASDESGTGASDESGTEAGKEFGTEASEEPRTESATDETGREER